MRLSAEQVFFDQSFFKHSFYNTAGITILSSMRSLICKVLMGLVLPVKCTEYYIAAG